MNLPKFSIKDSLFTHAPSSSGDYLIPKYFSWNNKTIEGDFVFITDNDVYNVQSIHGIKKYAWLVESPIITPKSYEFVYQNWNLFDEIFTHSKRILERPNAHLLPIGGCHISESDISMTHEKTKLISMMFSYKNFTEGHSLRHNIFQEFKDVVDIMGSGVTGQHLKKIHACKDYMFSIAIENCKEDYYFSEKIVDCFLTGVVPIYWGCPSISKFFNPKGILTFNTLEELYYILKNQENLYEFYLENKDGVIKENCENALKYKIAEDRLYLDYRNILTNT